MKTFDQIRQESSVRLDEKAAIHPAVMDRLSQGIGLRGKGEMHNGHEGAEREHNDHADEHKGTAAGKFHAKASLHHNNAQKALKKGNMTTSLKHAALAKDAAQKAKMAGGNSSASADVHKDHRSEAIRAKPTAYSVDKKKEKSAARANPVKAVIGKAKSKVKKVLRMGEDVEQVDEISDKKLDQYAKKAFKQYDVSKKRKDDSGSYTDKKRAQHADRFRKRSKGIGGYFQRDMAKRRTKKMGDGSEIDMGSGSKYIHKPTQQDIYKKGKKGMTMTGRPASAMPKSYQNPDRK